MKRNDYFLLTNKSAENVPVLKSGIQKKKAERNVMKSKKINENEMNKTKGQNKRGGSRNHVCVFFVSYHVLLIINFTLSHTHVSEFCVGFIHI